MALVCTAFWIFMAVSKSAQRHSLLTRACNLFFNSICVCPHAFAKMKNWYVLISVLSWNFKDGGSLKASFWAKNQHATKEKSLKNSYE